MNIKCRSCILLTKRFLTRIIVPISNIDFSREYVPFIKLLPDFLRVTVFSSLLVQQIDEITFSLLLKMTAEDEVVLFNNHCCYTFNF